MANFINILTENKEIINTLILVGVLFGFAYFIKYIMDRNKERESTYLNFINLNFKEIDNKLDVILSNNTQNTEDIKDIKKEIKKIKELIIKK